MTAPPPDAPTTDVVVVGNAGVDTNVYVERNALDPAVEGDFTRNVHFVGQAGGFASRGYAALGYRTAFLGALGEDAAGTMVRGAFARAGVDTRGVFLDPAGTARSVNLVFRDGRRRFFYDGKGHTTLAADPARYRRVLAGARLAHVNIPHWARFVLPVARRLGVPVACDLQDVVAGDDPYRLDFVVGADYLFFSAANHPDPAPMMRAYWRVKPDVVIVVGMGARGCALGVEEDVRHFPPPPLALPVVDTNGAGDALAVGVLTGRVLEGRSLEESVLRGQIAARHTYGLAAPKAALVSADGLEADVARMRTAGR